MYRIYMMPNRRHHVCTTQLHDHKSQTFVTALLFVVLSENHQFSWCRHVWLNVVSLILQMLARLVLKSSQSKEASVFCLSRLMLRYFWSGFYQSCVFSNLCLLRSLGVTLLKLKYKVSVYLLFKKKLKHFYRISIKNNQWNTFNRFLSRSLTVCVESSAFRYIFIIPDDRGCFPCVGVQSCHRSPWRWRRWWGSFSLQDQRLSHQVLHFHLWSYRVPHRLQKATSTQEARPAAKMTTTWWRMTENPETRSLKNRNLKSRQVGQDNIRHVIQSPEHLKVDNVLRGFAVGATRGTTSSWIESFPLSSCSFAPGLRSNVSDSEKQR